MYSEFVLPYLSRLAKEFGRIYYGCCESLHDRLDIIEKEITNIGAVSVSMWNNFDKIAEMISDKYVYSRKPAPPPLSGEYFDLEEARKDLMKTKDTAKDCCVEFIFRDLYDIAGDRSRLKAWTDMVKKEYSI